MAGRRTWTDDEVAYLKAHNQSMHVREIARTLGKTYSAVHNQFRRFKLSPKHQKRVSWTQEEIQYLKDNCTKSMGEIATALDRSVSTVKAQLITQGLQVTYIKTAWSKKELWELYTLAEKYDAAEIAEKMSRSRSAVAHMLAEHKAEARSEVYSLRRACKETGYNAVQLHRARVGLAQHWRSRTYKNKSIFSITQYQLSQLCEWLKQDSTPCTSLTQSGSLSSLPSSSPPSSFTLPLTKVA